MRREATLVKRRDDQEAGKYPFILEHPYSTVGTEVRARSVAPLYRGDPVLCDDRVRQPLRIVRQMLDPQSNDGRAFSAARPGCHDDAAANKIAKLRHDPLEEVAALDGLATS